MAKQSTYNRLKAENLQLKKDIRNILRGNFLDKEIATTKWNMAFDSEDVVWMGDTRNHIKEQSNG